MTEPKPSQRESGAFTVRKSAEGWRVTGVAAAPRAFRTKQEAVQAARRLLARKGGVLTIHGANGRLEHLTVLGGEAARRLNAVEGLSANAASRRLIKTMAGKTQTAAERRAVLLGHFRKARPRPPSP